MTTMAEALADYYKVELTPDMTKPIADMSAVPNSNERVPYGTAVPTKHQNKVRSGRQGRRAARNRQALAAVGGLSYKGPWDALKASSKPADYNMCRLEGEQATKPNKTKAAKTNKPKQPASRHNRTVTATSDALAAVTARFKAQQEQNANK